MRYIILIITLLILFKSNSFSQDESITIGKKVSFHSDVLNEEKAIYIHLPRNYEVSDASYPVIYILEVDEFIPVVGIVDYLSRLSLIPDLIVIGVPSSNRSRDFTPASKVLTKLIS